MKKTALTLMTTLAALTLAGPVLACDGSAGSPPIPTLVNSFNMGWGIRGGYGSGGALVFGVAIDPITGNVYAIDYYGHIWSITRGPAKGGPQNFVNMNPDVSAVYAANPATGQPAVIVNTIYTGAPQAYGIALDPKTGKIYVAEQSTVSSVPGNGQVLVFNESTNSLIATIPMSDPQFVAVDSATGTVYVTNYINGRLNTTEVVVVDEKTNAITATIPTANGTEYIALDPQRRKAFVTSPVKGSVTVIDLTPGVATTNTVIATIPVSNYADGVDVDPTTGKVYVSNYLAETVSVIDENTLTVINTISDAGFHPYTVVVDSDHGTVYVLNSAKDPYVANTTGIVINEKTDTVTGTFNVFTQPRSMVLDKKRGLLYIGAGEPNQDASLSIYKTQTRPW
jgi:YVTN family beta-propeller protein